MFVCFSLFSSLLANAETQTSKLHLAVQRDYPNAEQLPMPENINVSETARFSPLRNRDITSSAISVHHEMIGIDVTLEQLKEVEAESVTFSDPHLGSYDRHASVNLSSVMQSTVPEPFGGNNKFSHLNMPGGQWGQQTKYLSHELNSSHYTQLRQDFRENWSKYSEQNPKGIKSMTIKYSLFNPKCLFDRHHQSHFLIINKRFISLSAKQLNEQAQKPSQKPSTGELSDGDKAEGKETAGMKLKKAVKEYGSTVIVFHVCISLMSLGMFYALVSRWVGMKFLLVRLTIFVFSCLIFHSFT